MKKIENVFIYILIGIVLVIALILFAPLIVVYKISYDKKHKLEIDVNFYFSILLVYFITIAIISYDYNEYLQEKKSIMQKAVAQISYAGKIMISKQKYFK